MPSSSATGADPADTARPEDALPAWLGQRSDDELERLLRHRADVLAPAPQTLDVLAARLQLSDSVARVVDTLDLPTITVLAAVQAAGAGTAAVSIRDVLEQLPYLTAARRPAAARTRVVEAIDRLRDHGVVWGDDAHLRLTAGLTQSRVLPTVVLPRRGEPVGTQLAELVDSLSPQARAVLHRIARGDVASGQIRAPQSAAMHDTIAPLIAAGALTIDNGCVLVGAHVLYFERYGTPATDVLAPPPWPGTTVRPAQRDGAAAVAALELDHAATRLLDVLETAPLAPLRTGAVGIRELRRLSSAAHIDLDTCVLLLETLASCGLIDCGDVDVADEPLFDVWAPTPAADSWRDSEVAERLAWLAAVWWLMPRRPASVSTSGERPLRAVDPSASRAPRPATGKTAPLQVLVGDNVRPSAPRERADMATALALLPPDRDTTADGFRDLVRWSAPLYSALRRAEVLYEHLDQARQFGLASGWALSAVGHAAATFDDATTDTAHDREDALRAHLAATYSQLLPAPVNEVIIQADHTIVAPGPPTAQLAQQLATIADIETTGTATTYRLSSDSVRRALDTGRTASDLIAMLQTHSVTPIPQAVEYLIEDTARSHGTLRVGTATTVLRSDDTALIAELAAGPLAHNLDLRRIAPTVLISNELPRPLLAGLRAAGYSPVSEDASGVVVTLTHDRARVEPGTYQGSRYPHALRLGSGRPDTATIQRAVATLRSAQRAASVHPHQRRTGEAALALLHSAADGAQTVAISVVDTAGRTNTALFLPLQVGGGRVAGINPLTGDKRTISLHRIISVSLVT